MLRDGLFSHLFGENKLPKSRECASGSERGRKREEEAENNSPLEPAGYGENGGVLDRAGFSCRR